MGFSIFWRQCFPTEALIHFNHSTGPASVSPLGARTRGCPSSGTHSCCIGVAGMGLADPFIYLWILQALFGVKIIPGPPEADKIWQQGNTRHLFPLCNDPEAGAGGGQGTSAAVCGQLGVLERRDEVLFKGAGLGEHHKARRELLPLPTQGWRQQQGAGMGG